MVGVERFELPTLWSQTRCATRLRYTPCREWLGEYTVHFALATHKSGSAPRFLAGPVDAIRKISKGRQLACKAQLDVGTVQP